MVGAAQNKLHHRVDRKILRSWCNFPCAIFTSLLENLTQISDFSWDIPATNILSFCKLRTKSQRLKYFEQPATTQLREIYFL